MELSVEPRRKRCGGCQGKELQFASGLLCSQTPSWNCGASARAGHGCGASLAGSAELRSPLTHPLLQLSVPSLSWDPPPGEGRAFRFFRSDLNSALGYGSCLEMPCWVVLEPVWGVREMSLHCSEALLCLPPLLRASHLCCKPPSVGTLVDVLALPCFPVVFISYLEQVFRWLIPSPS